MSTDEAAQVLLNHVPPDALVDGDPDAARELLVDLAHRLGEWPLLLGIFADPYALAEPVVERVQAERAARAAVEVCRERPWS